MENEARWLTAGQAQARLGVNERTLRKWAAAGKLRRVREKNGRVRFVTEDVERVAREIAKNAQRRSIDAIVMEAAPATTAVRPPAEVGTVPLAGGVREHRGEPGTRERSEWVLAVDPLAAAYAREQLLLQEIQWLRAQLERLHETHREFCLLLLQNGRGPEGLPSNGHLAEKASARDLR